MFMNDKPVIYINETKQILKQIKSIILNRNQNLETCLWDTLDSTLDILFIFIPKLFNNENKSSLNPLEEDHITTVVNAATLTCSVIKVILSAIDNVNLVETSMTIHHFMGSLQRMKYEHNLSTEQKINYKLLMMAQLYQLVRSLLFVFLEVSTTPCCNNITKHPFIKPTTPPLTPDEPKQSIFSNRQGENDDDDGDYHTDFDVSWYYQNELQQQQSIKWNKGGSQTNGDTVGKRLIRSLSVFNKRTPLALNPDDIDLYYQPRTKIDEERNRAELYLLNRQKSCYHHYHIRALLLGHKKRIPKDQDSLAIVNKSVHMTKSNSYADDLAIIDNQQKRLPNESNQCYHHHHHNSSTEWTEPTLLFNKKQQQQQQPPSLRKKYPNWFSHHKTKKLHELPIHPLTPVCEEKTAIGHDNNDDEILRHAREKGKEGSRLYVSENGEHVLIMEVKSNYQLQVVAGAPERLFLRLADETPQDLDYVDTYILSHHFFTTPTELLENLMARFYLEATVASPSQACKKWQRCVQVKVLNVISRWVKLQFQDFKNHPILISRLEAFLMGDVTRAGFTIEADMIKRELDKQKSNVLSVRHLEVIQTLNNQHPNSRKPSLTPSFLSFASLTSSTTTSTPPDSPTTSTDVVLLLTFNSRDIAKYLTLADFYIFKCITAQDYLTIATVSSEKPSYIGLMTERANKLTQWVISEISAHEMNSKSRRLLIRKMIEIAKLCTSWNNFHTAMVITMGLTQLKEFREEEKDPKKKTMNQDEEDVESQQQRVPTRDMVAYKQLVKYLNVRNNMSYYRTALRKATATPCIPFFPIILKDLTFLLEGNESRRREDGLINFAKCQQLVQFVHDVLNWSLEKYEFAVELNYFPFFRACDGMLGHRLSTLDQLASLLEEQIYRSC
ncbi:MAG: ras guanine nucleotide exchange factor domain-containing protein [Benjaminiella poitrasii]|nr:MAG: ras guanine nucleotide exchange factor domain-containing protein [Benjaminiella poitrasii]